VLFRLAGVDSILPSSPTGGGSRKTRLHNWHQFDVNLTGPARTSDFLKRSNREFEKISAGVPPSPWFWPDALWCFRVMAENTSAQHRKNAVDYQRLMAWRPTVSANQSANGGTVGKDDAASPFSVSTCFAAFSVARRLRMYSRA
jgi:hypothetical protein